MEMAEHGFESQRHNAQQQNEQRYLKIAQAQKSPAG